MPTMPRCPHCNAQGIKNIAAKKLNQFMLFYCQQCGAIHSITLSPPTPKTPHKKEIQNTTDQEPEKENEDMGLSPEDIMAMGFYGQSTRYMRFPAIDTDTDK